MAVRLIGSQVIENPVFYQIGAEILHRLRTKGPPEKLEDLSQKFPKYREELSKWITQLKINAENSNPNAG